MISKWVRIEIHCDNEDCDNVFTWGANEYLSKKDTINVAKNTQGWKISKNFQECPSCIKKKKMSELDLIGGEFYLIDEKKCLYKSVEDNGIYYRGEGQRMFLRTNARSANDNSAWDGPPVAFTKSKK